MRRNGRRFLFASVLAALGLPAGAGGARAGFTVDIESVTPITTGPYAGDYLWTYSASIASTDSVIAGASGNNFFKIYDFLGYVPGSISAPAGWTASAPNSSPPPPPINVSLVHGDDPAIPNLFFQYTSGPTITSGSLVNGVIAGSFTAVSIYPRTDGTKDFIGQLTKTADGSLIGSGGDISVPVPEPAGVISGGIGLTLLALGSVSRVRRGRPG